MGNLKANIHQQGQSMMIHAATCTITMGQSRTKRRRVVRMMRVPVDQAL